MAQVAESLIKMEGYEGLFLPFPKESREYIIQCSEGIPLEYLLRELKELIPEPIGPWKDSVEPLLKALAQIKELKSLQEICCYSDLFFDKLVQEILVETARLTLRAALSNRIDTTEWREILQKDQKYREDALKREADYVILHADSFDQSVCVATNISHLLPRLKEEGYKTELISVERPYSLFPLETLRNKLIQGEASDKEVKEFVRLHQKFVSNYVLTSENLEKAYQEWTKWKKSLIEQLLYKIKRLSQKI